MRARAFLALALLAVPALVLADEKPKLEIEMTAPKELYPDEEVAVRVAIRNAGKETVHVLTAVDGAADGLRNMVEYKWTVTKNGQPMSRRTDIRRIDDHVNTITASDLVAVAPGKTMNPRLERLDYKYNLNTPGKYVIALTYSFDPSGRDKADADVLKTMQKLPAAKAEGKIEVSVVPFPPAVAAALDKMKAAQARHQLLMQFAETVAKNPNATAAERDAAAERLKRATAALDEAAAESNAKMAEFRKKRDEERKKK